jgi:hypothetical protein
MVFTMAAKATALLLTLPSVVNGLPILPPPQVNITLTENVPHSAALAITPGLEYLLQPDVPHINDPSIILGPETTLYNSTTLPKENSWIKGMLQRLGAGGSSTKPANNNNTAQPRKSDKKHSKRWWGAMTGWRDKIVDVWAPTKWDNWPVEVTLINATPYRWRRGHTHSYQMISWIPNWPKYIDPGQTVRITSSVETMAPWDAAGEVVYHLEGVSKPMSFEIRRRTPQTKDHLFKGDLPKEITVRYLENLETFKSPKKSVKQIKWWDFPASCHWVLAGKEGDFIAADDVGPGWMSEKMDQIGHIPLRELAIPRSHHAGMYKMGESFGMGSIWNTLTQYKDLTFQLTEGGVRVIDIRPFLNYGKHGYKTWESHGSIFGGKWHGALGVSLEDMINQVNAFNKKYPGELIIWDIHPNQALVRRPNGKVEQMSEGDRAVMYHEFKRLRNRVEVPDNGDLTRWPLEQFVANKTSGVLIRTRREWRYDESYPGGSEGFVTEANFPVHHVWANKPDTPGLIDVTVKDLKERKTKRTSTLYFADWIVTQQGFDVAIGTKFIAEMAITTYKALFYELWAALTMERYPNWIATDGIRSSESKSFAMTLNHCFAGGRCGKIQPSKKLRYGPDNELGFYPTLTWMDEVKEYEAKQKAKTKGGKAKL